MALWYIQPPPFFPAEDWDGSRSLCFYLSAAWNCSRMCRNEGKIKRKKTILLLTSIAPTFTIGYSSLPKSIDLTGYGLISARDVVSSNTSICTDCVTSNICTFICAGCWGDKTAEWSFQRGAINLWDTNILLIIQPIITYVNVNENNGKIDHVGFLKKLKLKLGSRTFQYVAMSQVQTHVSAILERRVLCGFINTSRSPTAEVVGT